MNLTKKFLLAIKKKTSVRDPNGHGVWKNTTEGMNNFFLLRYKCKKEVYIFKLSYWSSRLEDSTTQFDLKMMVESEMKDLHFESFDFPYLINATPEQRLAQAAELIALLPYCNQEIVEDSTKWIGDGYERDYRVLLDNLKNIANDTSDCFVYFGLEKGRFNFKLKKSDRVNVQNQVINLIKQYQVKES